MIPTRLEVKNFLPYRVPDAVRFDGIHLACLTGPNGAGKSSLLDAITWALWGQARAKRDDDLIHQGQEHMHVQLDFVQEGVMYRVFRQRTRGKKGTGTLNFFVIQSDGKLNTISEPSMRATQEKINRLLRLDYETFIHSAFLQQGKADAFTTQQPAQRKRILSDILGLERWAGYEDRVKEHLKSIAEQLVYLESRIKEINDELARKPALQAELADSSASYTEARTALEAAQQQLEQIKHAPGALKNAQENKTERERRLREYQRELQSVEEQINRHEQQIAEYDEIIALRADIETGYTALQTARDLDQSLNDKLVQLKDLDDQRYELRSQLDAARARLAGEITALEKSIMTLEQAAAAHTDVDLEEVQREVAALQAVEAERDALNLRMNAASEERGTLRGQLETLENEGKNVSKRLQQLESTDSAVCPLCGQPLDAEHRQELIAQLSAEVAARREDYREHQKAIEALDGEVKTFRAQVSTLEIDLKRLPALIERAGKLHAQQETAQQAAATLIEERAQLEHVQAEVAADAFAPDVRASLAQLDTVRDDLGYDKTTHDDNRRTLNEHHRYEQLQMKLSIALESLPNLQEMLAGSCARRDRLMTAVDEVTTEIDMLEGEIAGLQVQVEEYNAREREVREQHTRERTAYERLVKAQQALSSLDAMTERKALYEARREGFRHDEALYKELRTAFSKNGIPAMIIETAIPELEQTASDLLLRMTDGRMSLRLTTQKEKITGGVAETLDIEIADELGTRAYELYSGGEAFRINFALRVALSQLLARRAGAHLRTLFIDEGFGTQDDSGRNKLVEAITAIQDDFDLILVITHIDELRDSFPVHLIVEKTGSGSRISVR